MTSNRRGGDPLAAMYAMAALLLFLAGAVVVIMMFVPSDWRHQIGGGDDVYVPGTGPTFQPLGRGADAFEAPGLTQVEPGRYVAVINAYNWQFQPNEIRVPIGSEVTFRGRSIDDYHGIAIIGTDVILSLKQNEAAEATFTFTEPGEYLFVCSEYCGAGHTAMTGKVIVY